MLRERMANPRFVLFFTILTVGLSSVVPAAPSGAAAPKSLATTLRDELGREGSVAVLGSYDGLTAVSVDGKLRRRLVPGRTFGVRVDNRSEVIWYRAERTSTTSDLMMIDLHEPEIRPVLVIRDMNLAEEPEIAYETPDEITPPADALNLLLLLESGPVLQRKVDTCAGKRRKGCPKLVRLPCEPAPKGSRCLPLEPSALPVLKDIAKRGAGRSLFLPVAPVSDPRPLPMGRFSCRRCGHASAIPGTPYLAVLTEARGSLCHVVAEVFDPRTREFVDIDNGDRSPIPFGDIGAAFGDAWVASAGDAFIQDGILRTFRSGRVPSKGPAEGGGFLGGGWWVPLSNYDCDRH
jgi:hypothetical protein